MSARLRLGDLDKTMTVGEVLMMLDGIVKTLSDETIPALIEHWSDDDGLHHSPFSGNLPLEIKNTTDQALAEVVNRLGI